MQNRQSTEITSLVSGLSELVNCIEKDAKEGMVFMHKMEILLWNLVLVFNAMQFGQSRFSRTISAISEDLGIAQEKPTSGPIQDIVPGKSGEGSSAGEKCSE